MCYDQVSGRSAGLLGAPSRNNNVRTVVHPSLLLSWRFSSVFNLKLFHQHTCASDCRSQGCMNPENPQTYYVVFNWTLSDPISATAPEGPKLPCSMHNHVHEYGIVDPVTKAVLLSQTVEFLQRFRSDLQATLGRKLCKVLED